MVTSAGLGSQRTPTQPAAEPGAPARGRRARLTGGRLREDLARLPEPPEATGRPVPQAREPACTLKAA